MGKKKITFTLPEAAIEKMAALAEQQGFIGVPSLARHLTVRGMNLAADKNAVWLTVDEDIAEYAKQKKFGSTESFLTFAANSYMTKYPLTEAQKAKVDK